MLLDYKH